MKIVFDERQRIVFDERDVVWQHGEQRVVTRTCGREIDHDSVSFTAHCLASYDKSTGALHIKLDSCIYRDWAPAGRELVELHKTRERAIRRTIEIADDWYAEVACATPALPSPDEVLAAVADKIPY